MQTLMSRLGSFIAIAIVVSACTQVNEKTANLTPQYGTRLEDQSSSLIVGKKSSAIYSAGLTQSGWPDLRQTGELRRYNRDGKLAWKKTYNAPEDERITSLNEDPQGNIVLTTMKNYTTTTLFQYSPTGQELARQIISEISSVHGLAIGPDGTRYIVGIDQTFEQTVFNKYSQSGKLLWSKAVPDTNLDPIATDSKGNAYMVNQGGTEDWGIRKYSPSGSVIWSRTVPLGSADSSRMSKLIVQGDSLWLLGQKVWVINPDPDNYQEETDILLTKYNLDGNRLWSKNFGTSSPDEASSFDVDSTGNTYVYDIQDDSQPYKITKFAPSGTKLTQTSLNFRNPVFLGEFSLYSANEFYFLGETGNDVGAGYQGGVSDLVLLKTNGMGQTAWVR